MIYFGIIIAFVLGMLVMDIIIDKQNIESKLKREIEKRSFYYRSCITWIDMLQHEKSIAEYFIEKGYTRIAIYGMQEMGERVYCELMKAGIKPVCMIDRSKDVFGELPLYKPGDELPELDVIVVASEYYFSDIKKDLGYLDCPILGLNTIIGNVYHRAIV